MNRRTFVKSALATAICVSTPAGAAELFEKWQIQQEWAAILDLMGRLQEGSKVGIVLDFTNKRILYVGDVPLNLPELYKFLNSEGLAKHNIMHDESDEGLVYLNDPWRMYFNSSPYYHQYISE